MEFWYNFSVYRRVKEGEFSKSSHEILQAKEDSLSLLRQPAWGGTLSIWLPLLTRLAQIKQSLGVLSAETIEKVYFLQERKKWFILNTCEFSWGWDILFLIKSTEKCMVLEKPLKKGPPSRSSQLAQVGVSSNLIIPQATHALLAPKIKKKRDPFIHQ